MRVGRFRALAVPLEHDGAAEWTCRHCDTHWLVYLQAYGRDDRPAYSYPEIAELSRCVRVNVAVLLGADVGDMSLMEASRLPFVRSEASGGAPAVAALASKR